MTGLVVNGVRTQTPVKGNEDPEAFPFQTTQTRLNRWINTQDSANSVFSTRSIYVFSNRNNGSARRSATRVGKTEEARVFRENFYGGKNDFLFWKNVVWDGCLSFVQTTPLLTLITQHQFLTKTTILHFTSLQGTYSLPRVPSYSIIAASPHYTRRNQREFGKFWSFVFPGKHGIVVL